MVDHLVVAAVSLDEGVAWCERTLGITPGPGGEHPLMGTHNRLFNVSSPAFSNAYFEIIAIDPAKSPQRPAGMKRWFDLDDAPLREQLARTGPQLCHFVARTANASSAGAALTRLGIDRGELIEASRMTPHGRLSWKITVRPDGQRLFGGTLPTLIEWGSVHPAEHMPASGVSLESITLSHPEPDRLREALSAIGMRETGVEQGALKIATRLTTPRGVIDLSSPAASA